MAEIANDTKLIALKVEYADGEKKAAPDTKRNDKQFYDERNKMAEIANDTKLITLKFAYADGEKKSDPDTKRNDKGHDKIKKSAETRCCECETKQKEKDIAKKSNSDPKRDRNNKRTKRSAEVEDQREAESDQSCAIKICSCCQMCKDKDSGTQVKFRDERKKEGDIRCCDCANDPDTNQKEKDLAKKCCSDPQRDKNIRKTRRSTEIEDQREAESDPSCEKKICTCCQWCKDKEPESEEFQDKRKKNAEKHCCCDCASGKEQKTAHTDVRKKSDPDTKRKEKDTAKKCYSDPKRDKNNKKTRGSAEIKDERETESTSKTCSCCKLSKDKESSEKSQEVCKCREIGKKKQKNKKQDNAHSDEKMPCSKSEPLPAKNQTVPKPRRKKVKGKRTKGNSSISVIGTSFKDNCCACCALLAEYGHEIIKLFSLECHTKVTEIFCELCDVGCCLCNDCLNFLRKLICCIGDLFNKSG